MKFWWKFSVASFPTEILHKVPNSYGNDVGIFCIGLVALFFFWRVVGYFKGELQNKRKLLLMDVFCKCGISLEMVTRIQDLLAVLRSPRWTYGISETPQWLGILKPRNVEIKCHLYRNITPLKTNMSSKKVPFQKESNLFFRGCFSVPGESRNPNHHHKAPIWSIGWNCFIIDHINMTYQSYTPLTIAPDKGSTPPTRK